jgi:hypothetical protein
LKCNGDGTDDGSIDDDDDDDNDKDDDGHNKDSDGVNEANPNLQRFKYFIANLMHLNATHFT